MKNHSLKLDLKIRKCDRGNVYQHLIIRIEGHIPPDTLKKIELPNFDSNMGLVIYGKVPNWLYAYIARQCSSLAWISCFYPILEAAVVIKTNVPQIKVGEVIPITLSPEEILENAERFDLDKQRKDRESSPPKKTSSPIVLDGQIKLKANNSLPYQRLVIDTVNIPPRELLVPYIYQKN